METWSLNHPERGLIEVERGYDAEFLELYPRWPAPPEKEEDKEKAKKKNRKGEDDLPEIVHLPNTASLKERATVWIHNPTPRIQIKIDGKPIRRFNSVKNGRYPLVKHLSNELEEPVTTIKSDQPLLKITKSAFGDILDIDYREGDTIVEFDAPAGSFGEKRKKAMEESSTKRVLFPMLAGIGKSGWFIAMIVIGPIVGRIIDWLISLLPDWDIDLPDLPPIPDITLPLPNPPQIDLPVPNFDFLPEFDLPQAPDWVIFLMEYSKAWVPILIGIVLGIIALRNHKKSEETKRKWEQGKLKPSSQTTLNNFETTANNRFELRE